MRGKKAKTNWKKCEDIPKKAMPFHLQTPYMYVEKVKNPKLDAWWYHHPDTWNPTKQKSQL